MGPLTFTDMEQAALAAIFAETPEIRFALLGQLQKAEVVSRENTGGGFFTTISMSSEAAHVDVRGPLALTTYARIESLRYGLGFVLHLQDGKLHSLEGFSCGGEDILHLNLERLRFEIVDKWSADEMELALSTNGL